MYEDPFLIGGHCMLALFAAALGGTLAPRVSSLRRELALIVCGLGLVGSSSSPKFPQEPVELRFDCTEPLLQLGRDR